MIAYGEIGDLEEDARDACVLDFFISHYFLNHASYQSSRDKNQNGFANVLHTKMSLELVYTLSKLSFSISDEFVE